jgi:hypothetical protein
MGEPNTRRAGDLGITQEPGADPAAWADADGYPTDAACAYIAAWRPDEDSAWWADPDAWRPLLALVKDLWWMPEWGWLEDRDQRTVAISTGGWSGNESLITAMQQNQMFWRTCWWVSRRGGHYTFRLPERDEAR